MTSTLITVGMAHQSVDVLRARCQALSAWAVWARASHQPKHDGLRQWVERLEKQGASEAVLGQMDSLLKTARTQGRERDRIELLLIAADAQHRLGQSRAALRHLSMAVILAAPGKLMQPFQLRQGLMSRLLVGADTLALSVPTVKWHLHNAYVKLGVRSRSAALARARALKLLGR